MLDIAVKNKDQKVFELAPEALASTLSTLTLVVPGVQ